MGFSSLPSSYAIGAGAPRNLPARREAFTVIELLAVLGVIAVLLTVGIPLVSDASTSARKSARDLLRAHLQQARAHAIATGIPTTLIIPDYSNAIAGGRLIGIAEVEAQADADQPYKMIRLVQRWTELPDHIYFMNQQVTGAPQATLMDSKIRIESTYQRMGISCHYIVFGANGSITFPPPPTTTGSTTLALALGKGTFKSNTILPTQRTSQGASYDIIQINRLSARTRNLNP